LVKKREFLGRCKESSEFKSIHESQSDLAGVCDLADNARLGLCCHTLDLSQPALPNPMPPTTRSVEELFPLIEFCKNGDLKAVSDWIANGIDLSTTQPLLETNLVPNAGL
jgi:hypothetical protein